MATAWSAPSLARCGSLSLYVVLRFWNQLCSPPAVLLWIWVFAVLDYWALVSLPFPLSLGQGQWSVIWPPSVSMLWWFADYFSILQCCLTLDVAHWLRRWALCTTTWPISGSGLSPTCCQPFCLFSICLLKVQAEISFLLLPSFSGMLSATPSLCCVLVFSSLYIVQFVFFFFASGGQSAQGAMLVYPSGGWGKATWSLVLTCWSAKCLPSRFGAMFGGTAAFLVSQCNVAWRSFSQARGSGCQSFDFSCSFISAKCGSSISARFWSLRAHPVCCCALVAILDPPWY
jgi:hypothetical protein